MAAPEVDKRLLEELQEMGFSPGCATRALHYSGNTSLEDAIDWMVNHENDSDIDQMPLVPVDIDLDAPKPFPITEGVKIRAHKLSLRNGSNQLSKAKEKELEREREREREKERIQAGKRILEAKQIAEENARKRIITLREADKEEERKAREKIRQKFEADKAERRAMLGIPHVSSPSVQPAYHMDNVVLKKSTEVLKPAKFSKKTELLSDCLRGLKRYHKDDDARVKKALQTLQIYIRNVLNNPDVEKYRNIRLCNPVFQERVGSLNGGIRFLELCGFERTNRGQFLHLPREKVDMETLTSAMSALQSAITNPFFGLLSVELP